MRIYLRVVLVFIYGALAACSNPKTIVSDIVIYDAKAVITMDGKTANANAVAVKKDRIVKVGTASVLMHEFKGAVLDESFKDQVIVPGLIDPHVHMILGAMMYAKPMAPPWPVQTPSGLVDGLPTPEKFFSRIAAINAQTKGNEPLVIYGYHNLVHGPLDKHILDEITTDRALIIWHYSGHDFFLNSKALEYAKVDASWAKNFHGVPLGKDGTPTGRVYEDAVFKFLGNTGSLFLGPNDIRRGFNGLENMFAQNGVTTVAEMGYGLFGLGLEDTYYKAYLGADAATKVYLVPEHRAFFKAFGDERMAKINDMVLATKDTWPRVLPQIKLFTDAAFYSQTMRLRAPGYTGGQNKGTNGLWVTKPQELANVMRPYWKAGFDIHIHSNGDAAQDNTLAAFAAVKDGAQSKKQRLVLEHVGLIRPAQITKAKNLGAGVSVASHYVHYMGEIYQDAIGDRVQYMTPLASTIKAGLPTTMHSDAPLAPPSPLTAASVHMTRSTWQGGVSTPSERLTAEQALRAITIEAAWSLGLEDEIGSIEIGKQADFTILGANPLKTNAEDWPSIPVWGVVLGGVKHPAEDK